MLPHIGWVLPPAVAPVGVLVAVIRTVAFRLGSRDVLSIPPLCALEASIEPPADATRTGTRTRTRTRTRTTVATIFFATGAVGIGIAFVLGASAVDALLLAVASGALSFTGVVIASPILLPAVLRVLVTITAQSMIPSMAARNSLRSPRRTARATVGLVIAVTLMTTFSVGLPPSHGCCSAKPWPTRSTTAMSRHSSTSSRPCLPGSSVRRGLSQRQESLWCPR